MQLTKVQIPALQSTSNRRAIAVILLLSAAVFAFLFWLVYLKPAAGYTSRVIAALPFANAAFNSLSTCFLIAGFIAIKNRRYTRHMKLMLSALATSTLFFTSYVIYHHFKGNTPFTGQGPVRPIYFFILSSHIVLSAVSVPLILTSFYLALAGKYPLHQRVSKFTFPIWLYVSVTGVVVFVMLKTF